MKYKNYFFVTIAFVVFTSFVFILANTREAKANLANIKRIESGWLNVKKGTLYPHYDRATKAGVMWTYVSTDDNRLHKALIKDGWVIEKDDRAIDYHPDCCGN
mgnify:CR=1 FL=1